MTEPGDVTALLNAWGEGNREALDELIPLVYDSLRRLAHRELRRERRDGTLGTTALVHEAYLRLVDQTRARLDVPRALPGPGRADDAPRPGGRGPAPPGTQARVGPAAHPAGRGARAECRAGRGPAPARRGADAAGGLRPAAGPRGGAALLRRPDLRGDRGPARALDDDGVAGLERGAGLAARGARARHRARDTVALGKGESRLPGRRSTWSRPRRRRRCGPRLRRRRRAARRRRAPAPLTRPRGRPAGRPARGRRRALPGDRGASCRRPPTRRRPASGRTAWCARSGSGGMGTVYLAERDEPGLRKIVAVKVVRRGMDTEFVVRRFRNERQILAALEHPGIARLYDGGTTEEALPYFVMEYVDGEDLLAYCDERRLTIASRLQLFCRVLRRRPVRAPGAGRPPRPQALEHPGHGRGRSQAAGLRHRQAAGASACRRAPRWRRRPRWPG